MEYGLWKWALIERSDGLGHKGAPSRGICSKLCLHHVALLTYSRNLFTREIIKHCI